MIRTLALLALGAALSPLASAQVVRHCAAGANSVGAGARIDWAGPTTLAAGSLIVDGVPGGAIGLFTYGLGRDQTPFGDGFRCISGANWILARKRAALDGTVTLALASEGEREDLAWLAMHPTWSFQYLYRDPATQASGGAGFNASDAIEVTLAP